MERQRLVKDRTWFRWDGWENLVDCILFNGKLFRLKSNTECSINWVHSAINSTNNTESVEIHLTSLSSYASSDCRWIFWHLSWCTVASLWYDVWDTRKQSF